MFQISTEVHGEEKGKGNKEREGGGEEEQELR